MVNYVISLITGDVCGVDKAGDFNLKGLLYKYSNCREILLTSERILENYYP